MAGENQQGGWGLGGGLADLVSTLKGGVTNLAQINQAIQSAFPRVNGSFTLSAATTTVVTNNSIAANSMVFWSASNGTAALIVRTNGLYHATNTAGTSFTMSTQSGSATSGGTFNYIVLNPS